MKKLRKTDIESMERELKVLENSDQTKVIGGYTYAQYESMLDNDTWKGGDVDGWGYIGPPAVITGSVSGNYDQNDCWWRCISYLLSCGSSYSESDAYNLASNYYGGNFDNSNYAFTGSVQDMRNYVSNYLTGQSHCSGKILVFDPNSISGWEGNGSLHAVIVTGYSNGYYQVFDPQAGQTRRISASELNVGGAQGAFINVN